MVAGRIEEISPEEVLLLLDYFSSLLHLRLESHNLHEFGVDEASNKHAMKILERKIIVNNALRKYLVKSWNGDKK